MNASDGIERRGGNLGAVAAEIGESEIVVRFHLLLSGDDVVQNPSIHVRQTVVAALVARIDDVQFMLGHADPRTTQLYFAESGNPENAAAFRTNYPPVAGDDPVQEEERR